MDKVYNYILRQRIALLILILFLPFCKPDLTNSTRSEIRIRLPQDPETLNPVNYTNVYGLQIINLLFQTLLSTEDPNGELQPRLAGSKPEIIEKDSLAYLTYYIREGACWDNTLPVTGEDVAFSMKLIKCPLINNEKLRA